VALTVTFMPAPEPSSKGFGHSLAREAGKADRLFEYLVSLDFAGLGRSLQIPIRGSAAPPVLEVTPQVRAAVQQSATPALQSRCTLCLVVQQAGGRIDDKPCSCYGRGRTQPPLQQPTALP
jgi:hypothetical protein